MLVSIHVARDNQLIKKLDVATPGLVALGRLGDCEIRLEDDAVSRKHATLALGANGFVVEDSSSNGTRVNPDEVVFRARRELAYGSVLTVGPFSVLVATAGGPRETATLEETARRHALPLEPARPGARAQVGVAIPPKAPDLSMPVQLPDDAPAGEYSREAAERRSRFAQLAPLRRRIHQALLRNLDLAKLDPAKTDDPALRPRVITALRRIVEELDLEIPKEVDRATLVGELVNEALGLGPLEPLIEDPSVTEIMVIDPHTIYVEREGKLFLSETMFTDDERVRAVVERIVTPLGRRIDESQPLVDARLKDGSRVNAVIRPLALRGTCITIRKFPKRRLLLTDLISRGSVNVQIARLLQRCVMAKKNILISGGTGSGKTTLLNILSAAIPSDERIVTIEDAAELQLHQPHVVSLETKPANMEGKGSFTIRDLVKNSLRMRPDRIVVGECRGGEALDMLQAMNTGHDGSLTTIHSNAPREALDRLETLALMSSVDLPSRAIREQISRSINVIVQQTRLADGSRKVTAVAEVLGMDDDGTIDVRTLFEFEKTGVGERGEVLGEFQATGYLPTFLREFLVRGLVKPGEPCF